MFIVFRYAKEEPFFEIIKKNRKYLSKNDKKAPKVDKEKGGRGLKEPVG